MSLAGHHLTWPNWIRAGKSYLSPSDQTELDQKIGQSTTQELIAAVIFLLEKLKEANRYEAFMTGTIGSLHPQNSLFKDALRKTWRAGDLIATTNYDLTIEEAVDARGVTYASAAEILSVIHGDENAVIHLHGVYDRLHALDDIVADEYQYENILANSGAQFVQNVIGTHPLIIVGCGGTVEDPNLSGFISFVVDKLGMTTVPYFYLMKKGDNIPELPANAIPVFYGDDYSDLAAFLSEIASLRLQQRAGLRKIVAINPYQQHLSSASPFGRMHFSAGFNAFVGRESELNRLNAFLESGKPFSWWTVMGEGGMGKSRLVLEWLKRMPTHWFGYFTHKKSENVKRFIPFTDTVIVFDYILGKEEECAKTIQAYLEAFETSSYRLRMILIERRQEDGETEWLIKLKRELEPGYRIDFEEEEHDRPLIVEALSIEEEVAYTDQYLCAYLPTLPSSDFIDKCRTDTEDTARRIESAFAASVDSNCRRPLYLSIFTEVWLSKEGKLSCGSVEELLSEYLNKERARWKLILGDDARVDAYLRLLAMACAIGHFNISDVLGKNYLQQEEELLIQFFDKESGRPGGKNAFEDLFVSMDELVEDGEKDLLGLAEKKQIETGNALSNDDAGQNRALDDEDRLARHAPYIKLAADPHEVYLQMLVSAGVATEEESEELERVRKERIRRINALPDHAWIIEPIFPDIIREFIVSYTINDRDVVRFTKLARSNSVLELAGFLSRALEDWKAKPIFQKMVVTPPDEALNYFEYYVSLLISLRDVEDLWTVEQALLDSDPCFPKYEMELWQRIAIVLADRKDADRLYDSGCRFIEYIKDINGMVHIRDEAVNALEGYCIGLHNSDQLEKHEDYLNRCEEIAALLPENKRVGQVLCQNYRYLANAKLYHDTNAEIEAEWGKTVRLLEQYQYQREICRTAMEIARDYMHILLGKDDAARLEGLEQTIEKIYSQCKEAKIAELAALCSANLLTIAYKRTNRVLTNKFEKIKAYYSDYPAAIGVRSAFIASCRVVYLDTSDYRQVPEKILRRAKEWSLLYPEEIEFQEGYFGLLFARLEYAQANDMRNEQRRMFREMILKPI